MPPPNPTTTVTNPRIGKLIELEVSGRIKPEHQTELDTYRAQGLAPKKTSGNTLTEYQGKSTGFHERAAGADRDFIASGEGGSPVGFMGDAARAVLPENVVNANTSPERQKAQQAKKDFILASLRYESGAAIGQNEYDNQERVFFPQTGDSPEVIAQKAAARQRVIESLKVAAGPGVGKEPVNVTTPGTPTVSNDGSGEIVTPEDRELDARLKAVLAEGGGEDQVNALYARYNRPPVDPKVLAPILRARDEGRPYQINITPTGRKEASTLGALSATPLGAAAIGAGDAVTLGFQDEIAGALDGDTGQARLALDASRRENPLASGAGSFVGGALIPVGRGASTLRELAGVGGGLGAAYGFGSGTNAEERLGGAVLGGATGAALGAGFSKLGDIWRRRGGGGPGGGGSPADVAAASRDLNVPMLPADVGGTPVSMMSSLMRMTPGGAQPITSAARNSQSAAGDALSGIAAREGTAMEREAAGEVVRNGALSYRNSSRDSVGRIYDRAAQESGDARVTPTRALENLDTHIAELGEVPGGADGLTAIKSLRDDIAERGTVSVNGIRGMRTQLRQKFMKDGLVGSDLERRVNQAIDAASEDLATSLEAQGKSEAAKLYRQADEQWKERIKTLDDTILPIIGKKGEKSGEQITDAINAAAKGNNARLARLFDALPPEEAGTARASMIEGLGKAGPGAQNATGDTFSFNTFLTNWNKIGASAKNAMFSGENRKAIDQLALLAEKSKNASRFQNYSNTGIGILGVATGATGAAGVGTLGATLAGQYAFGRLLASPAVARAILKVAQAKNPQAIRARIDGLSSIAAKEGALAPEITGLQQRLLSALNDNAPAQAAASQNEEEGR